MAYIDIPRVKGKMAEHGFTISSLSGMLGINRNTLASYLEKPTKMPYNIVSDMASLLCDSSEEATEIFFADNLRYTKVIKKRS